MLVPLSSPRAATPLPRQILRREARALADGTPLGANLNLLSGATSDNEEKDKAPKSRPTTRWNRLQDDHL